METIYFYSHRPKQGEKYSRHVFSQWFVSEFVDENGNKYNCAEQYMMAEKARLFKNNKNNEEVLKMILASTNQKEIKDLGRKVNGFNEEIWNKHKFNIVIKGNMLKFAQNDKLKKILLTTGNKELVEAAPYDRIWGIGYDALNAQVTNRQKWGSNLLGKALEVVRGKLG